MKMSEMDLNIEIINESTHANSRVNSKLIAVGNESVDAITIALECHDQLVDALQYIIDSHSYGLDNSDFMREIAIEALAKAKACE